MPQHFMLLYRPTINIQQPTKIIGDELFLDCYNGKILDVEACHRFFSTFVISELPICTNHMVWFRMLMNLRQIFKSSFDNRLLSILSFILEIQKDYHDYLLRIIFNKNSGFLVDVQADIQKLKKISKQDEKLCTLETHIQNILNIHHSVSTPPKLRSQQRVPILYPIGYTFYHKIENFRAVIISWDPVCDVTMDWLIRRRNNYDPQHSQQPFYTVLIDQRDFTNQSTNYGPIFFSSLS